MNITEKILKKTFGIVGFTCKANYTIPEEQKTREINMENETLINLVKELRTQKEISQGKLAEMVGVTRQTIISLEKGSYIPSLLLAMRISEALTTPIDEIFMREVEK